MLIYLYSHARVTFENDSFISFSLYCSSFQAVNVSAWKSQLFWRSGDEITGKLITTTVTPLLNLSSGKTTKGASEHRVTLRTLEFKHQTNVTPIPILYKENFTKLPKWDFDDVYMQSSEAPRPVRFSFFLLNGICDMVLWLVYCCLVLCNTINYCV